jgi:ribosomal protein L7/L12
LEKIKIYYFLLAFILKYYILGLVMNFEELSKKINGMNAIEIQNLIQELKDAFKIESMAEGSTHEYKTLINEILNLQMKEAVELVAHLENTFGVKAAAGVGSGSGSDEESGAGAAEKSAYTVLISGFKQDASQKVKFIQALRGQAPAIALKDAMGIFDTISTGGNHIVFDNLGKDEATAFQKAMDAFCEVTLK